MNTYTYALKCHYEVRRYDSTDIWFLDGTKKEAILEALEVLEKDKNVCRVAVIELSRDSKIAEICR